MGTQSATAAGNGSCPQERSHTGRTLFFPDFIYFLTQAHGSASAES